MQSPETSGRQERPSQVKEQLYGKKGSIALHKLCDVLLCASCVSLPVSGGGGAGTTTT